MRARACVYMRVCARLCVCVYISYCIQCGSCCSRKVIGYMLSLQSCGLLSILWDKWCPSEAQPWHTSKEKGRKNLANYEIVQNFTYKTEWPYLTIDTLTSLYLSNGLNACTTCFMSHINVQVFIREYNSFL